MEQKPKQMGCISNFRVQADNFTFKVEKSTRMTKEEFMSMAAKRYEELQALNKLDNFYDYEKQFVGIWKELGREVLQNNIGSLPLDKRKKKEANHDNGSRHHQ